MAPSCQQTISHSYPGLLDIHVLPYLFAELHGSLVAHDFGLVSNKLLFFNQKYREIEC